MPLRAQDGDIGREGIPPLKVARVAGRSFSGPASSPADPPFRDLEREPAQNEVARFPITHGQSPLKILSVIHNSDLTEFKRRGPFRLNAAVRAPPQLRAEPVDVVPGLSRATRYASRQWRRSSVRLMHNILGGPSFIARTLTEARLMVTRWDNSGGMPA